MTIIAWDGKTIAADKQATNCDMRYRTTKMRKIASGEVLAWCGDQDQGLAVAAWYEDGADPSKWPEGQSGEQWSRLVVLSSQGMKFYERKPIAILVEDEFAAFGSGRDFAMGAMAQGASASQAVEIACRFSTGCGLGVDILEPNT